MFVKQPFEISFIRDDNNTISKDNLKDCYNFPAKLIAIIKKAGLKSEKRDGIEYYNHNEAMDYARRHSICNMRYISETSIRPADILKVAEKPFANDDGKIVVIDVACAFRKNSGISFICPICGSLHTHGCHFKKFGDGNGIRCPHCHHAAQFLPKYFDFQKYGIEDTKDREFCFNLIETEDPKMAGDFPAKIAKEIVNRFKSKITQ